MSRYPGLAQHMTAAHSMNRQFSAVTLSAELQNMRSDDWFGSADLLTAAQRAAAKERGELKLLRIFPTSGSVTSWRVGSPGDQKQTATTAAVAVWKWQNRDGATGFYLDTDGSPASFEVYVEFDIPRAEDV